MRRAAISYALPAPAPCPAAQMGRGARGSYPPPLLVGRAGAEPGSSHRIKSPQLRGYAMLTQQGQQVCQPASSGAQRHTQHHLVGRTFKARSINRKSAHQSPVSKRGASLARPIASRPRDSLCAHHPASHPRARRSSSKRRHDAAELPPSADYALSRRCRDCPRAWRPPHCESRLAEARTTSKCRRAPAPRRKSAPRATAASRAASAPQPAIAQALETTRETRATSAPPQGAADEPSSPLGPAPSLPSSPRATLESVRPGRYWQKGRSPSGAASAPEPAAPARCSAGPNSIPPSRSATAPAAYDLCARRWPGECRPCGARVRCDPRRGCTAPWPPPRGRCGSRCAAP
eukprot:scaffold14290_cov125-Isochrysis_galbana.AAC.19